MIEDRLGRSVPAGAANARNGKYQDEQYYGL